MTRLAGHEGRSEVAAQDTGLTSRRGDVSTPRRQRWSPAVLWLTAVILMLGAVVYQRRTGPTYPKRGNLTVGGERYDYRLVRSHVSTGNARVVLPNPNTPITGDLHYKRFRTDDAFATQELDSADGELYGHLPAQPAAGKLEYFITLTTPSGDIRIPEDPADNVIIRFKDDVPLAILLPHVLFMFFAVLIGMRAGLSALFAPGGMRPLAWITLTGMTVGGMILGPIVQKYAFGEYWTGFPFGYDLTDNKMLMMWLVWVVACTTIGFRPRKKEIVGRASVAIATVVMVIVYLIPHSLRGSELDYEQIDEGVPPSEAITTG